MILLLIISSIFLAISSWKAYYQLETGNYEGAEKNIFFLALFLSLVGFVGTIIICYELTKFLTTALF